MKIDLDKRMSIVLAKEPDILKKELLNEDGTLKLLSTKDYDAINPDDLRLFCHYNARYLLPTIELIEQLKSLIGDLDKCIEIGAGCGDLGRNLGVWRMTDNYNQEMPEVKEFYRTTGQPTIKYGSDVEKLDALQAVSKFEPDVVVAGWVTHWIDPTKAPPPGGGNIYGVKEDRIIQRARYVLVGSEEIHKFKNIMRIPHKKIDPSFVRSRRKDNKIWMWEKRG